MNKDIKTGKGIGIEKNSIKTISSSLPLPLPLPDNGVKNG